MLQGKNAAATVAVRNIGVARKFYQDKLGLKPVEEEQEGTLLLESGDSRLFVYESKYAGTNQATAVTWDVGSGVESLVKELKGKGVVFEKYDMPEGTWKGDIFEGGDLKLAWFKDPDANIHALVGH
jgi:hypothetical protein